MGPEGDAMPRSAAVEFVTDRDRGPGQMSKVVGLYQMLLRRALEHFFPDATLEPAGDRSFIRIETTAGRTNHQFLDDPHGLGLELEWFRTRYLLSPGSPRPFLPSERKLIACTVKVLERRFRALFEPEAAHREDMFHYAVEDFIVAEDLDSPDSVRVPAALEALRVAALSTYENRRVSTGVLLLGTDHDPASPGRVNPPGAPRYNVRLSAIKSLHRMCDGLRTLFVIDRSGDLAWAVDIETWADRVSDGTPLPAPCARPYVNHARATLTGGHVALVLSPSQEIKVFANGAPAFAFSDARWRLMDIPSKFATWCEGVGNMCPSDLAAKIFQAALNLGEERRGALFVVLRDPNRSLPLLVAPGDRITDEVAGDDPEDPDNLSPKLAKRALHHLARGQNIHEMDVAVLEALSGIDGAVVTDPAGRLLTFGAILRVAPEVVLAPRAVEGARTTAALAASFHGPVLKVSEDGFLTMFLGGRRVWEL
jgi:hypothetical protein